MTCCGHCEDAGNFFNNRTAKKDLKKYRRRGPEKSTRLLINSIRQRAVADKTLLDIGGGVGAIQFELFKNALHHSVNVDASAAYQTTSKKEAASRGLTEKTDYHFGDFTELAPSLPDADIVTLDKVICCYPNLEKLLRSSLKKTGSVYGLIFPRLNIITKAVFILGNLWFRIRGSQFRTYLHPTEKVNEIIRSHGFKLMDRKNTILWQIHTYEKS